MGQIEEEPVLDGGEYWYRVRFVKRVERVVEDDLELPGVPDETIERLAIQGRWGRLQAFRTALTVARIEHDNRSTVYTFKSQRILFEPYQYKPLLKILDSPDRRLLIADEVGLGKTIEAGLILTELQARRSLDRVLIVCPSRLRDKWREEMNRKFDQDFDILTKATLNQYLEKLRQNPRRGQLRAIVSMQTIRGEEVRTALVAEVGHLDMVIVDEAHHARNPATQTSEMLRDLGGIADCMVLLTATPLHLGNRDLFTLLHALRPTEFRDANVFDRQLRENGRIHEASSLVRRMNPKDLPHVKDLLERALMNSLRNPLALQVIEDIEGNPPRERRDWVELERRIQELHPLGTIVTRTRKRDVQEHAAVRKASVIECRLTEGEDQLYLKLVQGSSSKGWIREKLNLGQIQRARQAASCLPAAALHYNERTATSDDDAVECTDILPGDLLGQASRGNELVGTIRVSETVVDSKYDKLQELLRQIWEKEPEAKVLIFTFFLGTATYLRDRLADEGIGVLRIAGDVPSNPHEPERDERGKRMRAFREDRKMRVLVSTEVGSEGLDFQYCHHLVNYDLPWNPMVVEQRIGRIDRFGQLSDAVYIHNLVVKDTVEEKILHRLYDRIGIFKESIGDLESILGETISELQRDYVNGRLTPEQSEERVQNATNAILRRKKDLETLQQAAGDLFGHEEYIRDEMQRVGRLGRYISEHSLLALITNYLQSHHPAVKLWDEEDGIFGMRLRSELRADIRRASIGGPVWFDRSQDDVFLLTTRGELAFRRPNLELINASHPLVRAAAGALKVQLESPLARVGQASLVLLRDDDAEEFPVGIFFIAVYTHTIAGIRARRVLEPIAWSQQEERILDQESGERLLHLVLERAVEWEKTAAIIPIPGDRWTLIEGEARTRNRKLLENERRENEAQYTRRREALHREYQHDRDVKQQRLDTARKRGRDRILPALQGQLQRADADYQIKLEALDRTRNVSARLSEPVAICGVAVNHKK